MRRDMPDRLWPRLPETRSIQRMVGEAAPPLAAMRRSTRHGARPFVPAEASLDGLQAAAAACEGCELHRCGSRVVFGEGPRDARLVLVGEQPGDVQDRVGRPFVGPAGEVLDAALAKAGIARPDVYLTNAVKHFRFVERGKRRIHQTPRMSDVADCRPWLEAELAALNPETVVCLGATASKALLGSAARVNALRGRVCTSACARRVAVTVHPSACQRAGAAANHDRLFAMVDDAVPAARCTQSTQPGGP
jgi:DNA polymerase